MPIFLHFNVCNIVCAVKFKMADSRYTDFDNIYNENYQNTNTIKELGNRNPGKDLY